MPLHAAAMTCPACQNPDSTVYGRHKDWILRDCRGCGLIYIDPLPGPVLLDFMYRDTYEGATSSYFTKVRLKMRRGRQRMALLSRRVAKGRLLDVGCNGGFMAEAARERGFESWGIDVDPVSIRYAQETFTGCRFEAEPLGDFLKRPEAGRFDLIYCSEVIEHIPAVDAFMGQLAAALAPGGHLFLTTPDIGHWRRPSKIGRAHV